MKLLNENNEMLFAEETAAITCFSEVCDADLWQRVYTNEMEVVPIDNAPILMDEIRQRTRINPIVSDESVQECMESLSLGLTISSESKRHSYPLGNTALTSIVQRAGYQQSPVLLNTNEKASQNSMAPCDKAAVLNLGFAVFKNSALVLIRDEKVRAVLSGDESDYSVLRYDKLHNILKEELQKQFSAVTFKEGTASHTHFSSTFEINDVQLNKGISKIFTSANINTNGMVTAVRLVSSDVGVSGANIYPLLRGHGSEKLIGLPLVLTHKNKHSLDDFRVNVQMIMSMFKEAEEKIKEMSEKKIKHPAGCLMRIAKQVGLPKKLTCEMAPDFEDMYGDNTYQIDVYWKLFELLDDHLTSYNISKERQINIEEGICRIAFSNMTDYDIPFQWE